MLKTARVVVLIVALCVVCAGFVGGGVGLLVSVLKPNGDLLTAVTLSFSFFVLLVGCGSMLAWHAWWAIQRRPSALFLPRRSGLLILAFVLSLVIGQVILSLDLLPVLTFPPFHVVAVILPAVAILGLVGARLGAITRQRDVALQVSSGALLSTFLALVLESAVFLGLLIGAFGAVAVQPGGVELIEQMAALLEDVAQIQDLASLAPLARSPLVIAGVFLVAALLIPLIEEGIKVIGVALLGYRRPSLAQAFLWGLAGGAGFALAEGLFNAAGALDAWGVVALTRSGATLLHCFTGALMGLAWHYLLVGRRWGSALGLYIACVSIHALWNALTAAMTLLSLSTLDGQASESSQAFVGIGSIGFVLILGILAAAVGVGLVSLTLYVARQRPALEPVGDGPPAAASVADYSVQSGGN